jgi:hypothetical protein
MAEEVLVDPWSYFDYKPTFPESRGVKGNVVPFWVGEHFRRLSAYNLCEAYYRISSRRWLDVATLDEDDINNRREYGEPFVVVQQMVASVLGEDQSIVVDGATGSPLQNIQPEAGAVQQQEVLVQWWDDERMAMKLIENERNCQKLGDGVFVLYDDEDAIRPRVRCYNPGQYFPVLSRLDKNGWPLKIHLAWEFEEVVDGQKRRFVTRATWELVTLPNGQMQELPWNDDPTDITCLYSKGTWKLDDIQHREPDPDLFDDTNADWEVQNEDLEIDYIPVIHIPNGVSEEEHFGTSIFANVVQIFDDLISTDTDLQASSATTGSPPIAVGGVGLPVDDKGRVASYGPGTVWQTGDGDATMIDTSTSLDALLKYDDALIKRLSVNVRIPESLMGRIKPSEVPSGITLALSFAPHGATVREMRMVRRDKLRLMSKFVSRWYMRKGELTELFDVDIVFGSFLPSHKKEVVDLVVQCMNTTPPIISLETAVRMLIEAGFPIEDAVQEVRRILENDFQTANEMLDATGDPNLVRARLGLPPLPAPPLEEEEELLQEDEGEVS